jgi:anti-anti-sigma factor
MASAITQDVHLNPVAAPGQRASDDTRLSLDPATLRHTGITCTVARLSGDLDISAAAALRASLHRLLLPGTRLVMIDLSDVPSCDLAGLAVLIGAQRSAAARGITVRVTGPSPQVAELLRSTGLDRRLIPQSELISA